jgi:hypothetical protein
LKEKSPCARGRRGGSQQEPGNNDYDSPEVHAAFFTPEGGILAACIIQANRVARIPLNGREFTLSF